MMWRKLNRSGALFFFFISSSRGEAQSIARHRVHIHQLLLFTFKERYEMRLAARTTPTFFVQVSLALNLRWLPAEEMSFFILAAFVPESRWFFFAHLYSVSKKRLLDLFSFPKDRGRRLKVDFYLQDSMHIFNMGIIKWKSKKIINKNVFHLMVKEPEAENLVS